MSGSANKLNGTRRPLNLADARRRQPSTPPPVDAAAATRAVLDQIAAAARVASMTAARHQASGCPAPGDCRPCAGAERRRIAEERRLYEQRARADRRDAIRQHHESVARLAEARARRRPRADLADMARLAPSCATCEDAATGLVCKSCGTARYSNLDILDTINGKGGRR